MRYRPVRRNPFPDKQIVKLTYSAFHQINPAASTYTRQYNLNSVFDPDRTGVGHQPMYFDQLAAVYGRYRVYAAAYEVTVSNANVPVRFVVVPHNQSSAPSNVEDAIETRWSQNCIVNTMSDGGGNVKTLKRYISLKALLGEDLSDDRDQALVTASPSNVVLISAMIEALDGSSTISSINFRFKLNYYVEFFDRNTISGS